MASISSGITGTNAQIEISLGNSCIKVDINSSPGSQRTCTSCHGDHGSSSLSSAREKGKIKTRNSYLINRIDSQQNIAHQKFYDSSSYVNGVKDNMHSRKRSSISNSYRDSFSQANHNMYDDHFRNRRPSSRGNCFMASAVNETQSVCTDTDYEELSAEKNGSLTTDSRIFDLLEIDESHKIVTGRSVLIAKSSSLANPFQVSSSRSSSSSLSAENLFATAAMSTEQLASPAKITVIDSVNKAFISSDNLFKTDIPITQREAADTEVVPEEKETNICGCNNGNYSAFLKLQESPSIKANVKEKQDDEVVVKPESAESEQRYSLDVIKDTGTAVFYSKDPSLMMYLEESCLDQPQHAEKSQRGHDEDTENQHKELRLVKYIPQLPTSNLGYRNKIQDIKSSLELDDDESTEYQQSMKKKTSFKSIKCNRKDTLSSLLSSQLDLLKTHSAPETPHSEKDSSGSDNFDLAMEASILDPDRIPFVEEYQVLSCESTTETTGNKHLIKRESNNKSQFFNRISAPNTSISAKSVEGLNSWVGFLNRHLKLDDNLEKSFILNTPGFEMSATEIKQMNTIASEQKPKSSPINELFGQKRTRLSSRYRKSKNNEQKESRNSDAENTNIDISKCSLCGKAKAYYYCDTCNKKHYYHHHRYHKKGSINWSMETDHTHKHKEEPEFSYCKSCRQKKTSQFEKVKQAKISARKKARKERRSKALPKNFQNDKSVSPLRSEFLEFKTALESHVPTLSAKSMKNAELKNVTDKKKVEVVISDSKIIDAAAHEESVEVKDSEKTDTAVKENASSLEVSPKIPLHANEAAKKMPKKSSKTGNKNYKKTKTKKPPTPESSIKTYSLESSKSSLVPRWQNRLTHPPLKKLYSRSPKFSKNSESAAQKGAATAEFFENGVNAGSLSNTLISEPCPFRNQTKEQKEAHSEVEVNLHNTLKDTQDQNNNFSLSRRAKLFFKGKNKFQKHSRNSKTEETKANPLGEILIN